MILIACIISIWLLVQTTPVQNFLVRQITHKLSKDLHTTVTIHHVNFALFNSMLLEGALVMDQSNDTLLYAGSVKLNITDWFFFKDKIELEYIELEDASIHLNRSDSVWNYNFLVSYFSGPGGGGEQKNINLNLKQLELHNINIIQRDEWRGEDLSGSIRNLNIDAEEINFNEGIMHLRSINLDAPSFAIYDYDGKRIQPAPAPALDPELIVNDPLHLRYNSGNWKITIDQLNVKDGIFRSDIQTDRAAYASFDGAHIMFSDINGIFKNLKMVKDSITAKISFSAKERSGFRVKQLSAKMKMYPEGMEFDSLDLQTNASHLHNYFAMRYASFDDMPDFVSKVRMEANFNGSVISSDDIAFFAPPLHTWKKKIQVSGYVKGSVDNLNGKNLVVQAGNDTYLKGNIGLAGLPDIEKTYIDFEAEDFRTTYRDAVAFVPVLKEVSQPRLDLLEYLRFKGNFTGFMNDFVTYGSLETNLGTVVTDLNMKFADNTIAKYSGSIKTSGFLLGGFVDNKSIGMISFKGNVNGSGLSASTVNAKLDGDIQLLEFNNYAYQDITVRGEVAKKLFNGELVISDQNLQAKLNGLIDFGKKIPEFNFEANIAKADLQKLNILKEYVEFNGKFQFDFKGNNVDNFLGTARIFDASLYKSGKRISFDSLAIESKIIDSNKVITAVSNEFDAAIAGEFSINDLPSAFQTFLNKYYPSYINPSEKILTNENFSFVITTKNVEEYVNLFTPELSGFNYSNLTGRINTRENLLDLNTDIPQFNYKNISFYDLKLKATGDFDSLSVQSEIANIYINDSLHFPGTTIRIKSAKDISDINIRTSANQTLNSANIAAQVQTLPKGAKIKFRESSFDLNGKNWTIDKDGELILTEDLVSADGIKLYNGQQEILVTSVPSDIGNSNDIRIDLKSLNIGDFTPYVVTTNRLEGLLTGTIDVVDPFGKLSIEVNAEADQFRLDNDSIGKLSLNGNYSHRLKQVNFKALSENHDYNFDLKGIYSILDSVHKENLDISADLKNTKIDLLEPYLSGVFSDLTGLATGALRINGAPNNLNYLGKIRLTDGGLRVKFTNVYYKIPVADIELKEDRIDFGILNIEDELKNKAQVTRAQVFHHSFDNLSFDFAMTAKKLLVLSTNNVAGDPFFGKVIAKANMTFTGPLEDMQMNIEAEPADSSSLYINIKSGKESGQADFIVWKVYGREMQAVRGSNKSNLTVNLDVNANNYANMYVILDELTGDIIRANGSGNLKIKANTDGEFTIAGRYDIERGNYNFNFESLLKKPFKLREGVGNYIQWSGDPNDATIKIDAEYEAENVRFSDLGYTSNDGSALSGTKLSGDVAKYRGKVLVIASLTDRLLAPTIKFQIELPPNSPLKNDLEATAVMRIFQTDENELNKQVAFLLVFNSFGPLSTSTSQGNLANTAFEGIVVGSISGVLSNTLSRQFSNVFQKIFNDKSIKVNFNAQLYSGTNFVENVRSNAFNIDRTNLNLSIGKSLFNERLTFNFGSAVDFGLSTAQVNATKNLPFLPDITAEWKISADGKLALTFFYRDSYNYLSTAGTGARQNRSGASISYRREFDNVGDLRNEDRKKKKEIKENAQR